MSSADLEKWTRLALAKERALFLVHKLAPNARAPEWWFTNAPVDIIAGEFMRCEGEAKKAALSATECESGVSE